MLTSEFEIYKIFKYTGFAKSIIGKPTEFGNAGTQVLMSMFKCTICDAVFTLKENLNKHIESYHDASKYKEQLKCKI